MLPSFSQSGSAHRSPKKSSLDLDPKEGSCEGWRGGRPQSAKEYRALGAGVRGLGGDTLVPHSSQLWLDFSITPEKAATTRPWVIFAKEAFLVLQAV